MSSVYFQLSTGDFAQDWNDISLLSGNLDWSKVPAIVGYRGDGITSGTGVDPRTLTSDGSPQVVDITVNLPNPNTFASGGVAEFHLADPVVALQGSGTADAPSLVFHLDATGREQLVFSFTARDIDGSADNAIQQVAVQYRVGETGAVDQPARRLHRRRHHGWQCDATDVDFSRPPGERQQSGPGPGARHDDQCRRQ